MRAGRGGNPPPLAGSPGLGDSPEAPTATAIPATPSGGASGSDPGAQGAAGAGGSDQNPTGTEARRLEQLRPFGPGATAVPERPLAPVAPAARGAAGVLSGKRWGEAQGAQLQELIERERREMAEPAGAVAEGPPEETTTTTSRGPNPPQALSSQSPEGQFTPPHPWTAPPAGALPGDRDRQEEGSDAMGGLSDGDGGARADRRRRHWHRRHQPRAEEGLTDSQLAALVRSL